jgi:tetratricopeptide (TPR) repeat protein
MKHLLFISALLASSIAYSQTDSAQYYRGLALKAKEERRFMVADKYFNQALSYDKNNETIQMEMASGLMEMKKYSQARAVYGQMLEKNPGNKAALEQMALLTFTLHQWTEAEKYGRKCIENKIGTGMNYRVAKSLFQQENYGEASKYLEKASTEEPKNAEVPWLMANIWLEMNHAQKGIEMYEIALSLDSGNASWHYDLAGVYNQTGDPKKAIIHYEKALTSGISLDINTLTEIGNAYLANKQFDKGMEMMNKVIAKKPLDKTIYNDVAYAFYNAKKYKDAIDWWDKILQIDKQDAKALYMIGIAYQKDGNKDKGSKLCDIAIQLDPSLASLRKEQKIEGMGL